MTRTSFVRIHLLLAGAVLAAMTLMAHQASAQTPTYINQTSCVSGACIVGGALQTQTVNCDTGGKISSALAAIADRNGPNIINVSGTCNESVNIVGHNRLTLTGSATINQSVNVTASRNISLTGLTIQNGFGLNLQDSSVTCTNTTVRNSQGVGIVVVGGSNLTLNGTGVGNVVTANPQDGISVGPGSAVVVGGNESITANGGAGVFVHDGGLAVISSGAVNGTVDISNNSGAGVQVENQSGLHVVATQIGSGGSPLVHIHDNHDNGVNLLASIGQFEGNVMIDGNSPSAGTIFDAGVGLAGSTGVFSPGVQVSSPSGAGIAGIIQSRVVLGDLGASGGSTVSGSSPGIALQNGSLAIALGPNSVSSMSCDATSWASGSITVGSTDCGNGAPTGVVGAAGPQGPAGADGAQGPAGPQGPQGPAGSAVSQTWLTFIRQFDGPFVASRFTPDSAIKVTRVQLQMAEAPKRCTVGARVRVSDGVTSTELLVDSASEDSGSLSLNFAAGVPIAVEVNRAAQCAGKPIDANVLVQYKAQ